MTEFYPVHHEDGTIDHRYSVVLEYCGYQEPLYVVRFCGDFMGRCLSYAGACVLAQQIKADKVA